MKKSIILSLISLMFFGVTGFAQSSNTLKFNEDISIRPGMTADIDIILNNGTEAQMLLCDIQLPTGISVVKTTLNSERVNGHTIDTNLLNTNKFRILIDSPQDNSFIGSEGTIVTMRVKASSDFAGGEIKIIGDGKSYLTSGYDDINFAEYTATIKADQTAVVYNIYVKEPVSIKAGETATMEVMLENNEPVNTWFASFGLPEGISVENVEIGRKADHVITRYFVDSDNELNILVDSPRINDLPGTEGVVATITLKAADTLTPSNATITMYDAYVIGATGRTDVANATYTIAISTGIQNVENAAANNGAIYNLNGQRVSKAANGIFIQNGKKAVVK